MRSALVASLSVLALAAPAAAMASPTGPGQPGSSDRPNLSSDIGVLPMPGTPDAAERGPAARAAAALKVNWPTKKVVRGKRAVADHVMPASRTGRVYEVQIRVDGKWYTERTYDVPRYSTPVRLVIRFDTREVGTATYRLVAPGSALTSSTFTLRVVEPSVNPGRRAKKTRITLSAPSATSVEVGKKVSVRGKVKGGHSKRKVILQVSTAAGWQTHRVLRTNKAGAFTFTVPTHFYGTHKVRVVAASKKGWRQAVSPARSVKVTTGYTPAGSASSWEPLYRAPSGLLARWNPCQTIPYRINAEGVSPAYVADVHEAFRRVTAATGLKFTFKGSTTKTPWRNGATTAEQFEKTGLVIDWANETESASLAGSVAAVGGSSAVSDIRNGRSVYRYTYGGVLVDTDGYDTYGIAPGFDHGATNGALLMHEIAHAIGLGHVDDVTQIMRPNLMPDSPARFGAGDLAGLQALGASRGCL